MSVSPAEMPIRRRVMRALRRGLSERRVARLYDLPLDFVRRIAAGPQAKTARRRRHPHPDPLSQAGEGVDGAAA